MPYSHYGVFARLSAFRGADLRFFGGLLPFQGAGVQVDEAQKWRNGVGIMLWILVVQRMTGPSKRR
ncbi:hypothetical protein F8275_03775 [Bifidobacterium breve]|nr:hypothetical protein EGX97_01665 [Bifidobacterium breve]KAB1933659.1 hypothetical protein F8275_03775 [Bifidobacterium breve]MED7617218.1 hypothetical protein [Bifidobacterium breve]MED7646665.1 hypothetical protein [Bifidobacterium breve]PVV75696.1 hypothetical protein DD700_03760 [Bifidobacterium breve]